MKLWNLNNLKMVIHIISHKNKWAVVKSKAKRATSLHTHREEAYFAAMQLSHFVVVHNKDGSVLFASHENKTTMKSEKQIQKRRDALKLEAQKISSKIDKVDLKLKNIPEGLNHEHLRKALIKEKESLHISLGLINSRWAELLWVLNK